METATRGSVIREGLEEIFDEHQDVDSKVYRGADNPYVEFEVPVGAVGPELGTSLSSAGNPASQGRDRLLCRKVVFEHLPAHVGDGLGGGEREAGARHVLHPPVFIERLRSGDEI